MMDRYDFRDSCTFFNLHMGRPIDWFGYMVISVIPGNTSRQDAPNDCCDCALEVGVEGAWKSPIPKELYRSVPLSNGQRKFYPGFALG